MELYSRPAGGERPDAGGVVGDPERVGGPKGGAVAGAGRPPVGGRVDDCRSNSDELYVSPGMSGSASYLGN